MASPKGFGRSIASSSGMDDVDNVTVVGEGISMVGDDTLVTNNGEDMNVLVSGRTKNVIDECDAEDDGEFEHEDIVEDDFIDQQREVAVEENNGDDDFVQDGKYDTIVNVKRNLHLFIWGF